MAEYIEREAVNETIETMISNNPLLIGERTDLAILKSKISHIPAADVQPVDNDNGHIIYIGRKAYLAENIIIEFMKKMDIIRDSLAYIEKYFDTYAETIRQIHACAGECTDIAEVKYFIDRIKENCGYD